MAHKIHTEAAPHPGLPLSHPKSLYSSIYSFQGRPNSPNIAYKLTLKSSFAVFIVPLKFL